MRLGYLRLIRQRLVPWALGLHALWEFVQCTVLYDMWTWGFWRATAGMWGAIAGDVVITLGVAFGAAVLVGVRRLTPPDRAGWAALLGVGSETRASSKNMMAKSSRASSGPRSKGSSSVSVWGVTGPWAEQGPNGQRPDSVRQSRERGEDRPPAPAERRRRAGPASWPRPSPPARVRSRR